MILIDGVKFNLHNYDDEKELEEMIKEHSKEIFGEDSIYFDLKKELKSESDVRSIPDGYVVTLAKPYRWYIVEGELANHPLHKHITNQLNEFMVGIKNLSTQRELVNILYAKIKGDELKRVEIESKIGSPEIKGFLFDLIEKPPEIVVIIDQGGRNVEEACGQLKVQPIVREFKTFVRENAEKVHAHLFEPLYTVRPPKSTTEKTSVDFNLYQVKVGDSLELEVRSASYRKFAVFYLPKNRRRFFPGYKVGFVLETDIGDIETKVSSAKGGTPVGDSDAGAYIQGGLKPWYAKHPEVTVGRKVRFECIESYRKYRLLMV